MDSDQRNKVINIIEKANTDEAFRKKLLNNANKTLEEEQVKLPEKMKVTVHENTKKTIYFAVPFHKTNRSKHLKRLPRNPSYSSVISWITYQVQENTPLKEKLLSNPLETLQENGVEIPHNLEVHIFENKDYDRHFVLPRVLSQGDSLDLYELEAVAGGKNVIGGGIGAGKANEAAASLSDSVNPHNESPGNDPHFYNYESYSDMN